MNDFPGNQAYPTAQAINGAGANLCPPAKNRDGNICFALEEHLG
jgi:hypothetical protein